VQQKQTFPDTFPPHGAAVSLSGKNFRLNGTPQEALQKKGGKTQRNKLPVAIDADSRTLELDQ